jgi:hypothetical protein
LDSMTDSVCDTVRANFHAVNHFSP